MAPSRSGAYHQRMVRVVHRKRVQTPRPGEGFEFLRRMPDGTLRGCGAHAFHDRAEFYVAERIAPRDLAEVIADATSWARLNDVSTVYIQKVAHA